MRTPWRQMASSCLFREAATDVNQLLTCLELLLATHDSTDFRRLHATVRWPEWSWVDGSGPLDWTAWFWHLEPCCPVVL